MGMYLPRASDALIVNASVHCVLSTLIDDPMSSASFIVSFGASFGAEGICSVGAEVDHAPGMPSHTASGKNASVDYLPGAGG